MTLLDSGTSTWDEPDVYDPEIHDNEFPGMVWVWDCYQSDFDEMLFWYSVPATPPPVH